MSTSLGRLVLDMAANAAGFERDMQKISASAKKELNKVNRELRFAQRDLDQARGKVTKLATALGGLGAVGLAAAGREFRQFAQEADGLDKVSRTVALTVEELQELRFAAEQAAGITSNTLDMAMQRFARRVGEAANDTGELNGIVKELGIELRNADGSLKSQTELLGIFADEIANAESEQEQLRIAFKLFDSEGARMVTMLRQGSGAIDELREQFRATGAVISGDTVDATVRFNDAMNVLTLNIAGLRNEFMAGLIQPLADYADFLANTEQGQATFKRLLEDIGTAAQTVGVIVGVGFTGALVKATVQMALAEVRVARLTAAKLTLNGASRTAALGVTLFSRSVAIATGPVGIIIGLLSTLGITYLSMRDSIATASEEFDEFTDRIDRARESTVAFRSGQLQADLIRIGASVSEINEELERLQRVQIGMEQAQFGDPRRPEEIAARVRELTAEQTRLRESAAVLNDQLEALNRTTEEGSEVTEDRASVTDTLADSIEALTQDLRRQIERLRQEKIETIGGARALLDYRIAKEAANGATVDQIRELERLRNEVLAEQAALDAATGAMAERQRQAEALAMQMRDVAAAFIEAATGIQIFNQQDIRQRGAAAGAAGAFDRFASFDSIGSGFAQSIFNGQSITDALESAFTGFGGEELSRSAGQFFDDALSDGLSAAFQNSKTQQGIMGGFSMAIGQALQGNYVQAAFTAAGTAIAGPIGGMIGSIIGGLISQKSDPNFQIRSSSLTGRDFRNLETDETLETALGSVEFGFRYIENGVQSQVMNALEEVDSTIGAALRGGSLLDNARSALETFGASSRAFDGDLEALLESRLEAVVRTFDGFVSDFILSTGSLEGQLENLQAVTSINRALLGGATLGLGGGSGSGGFAGELSSVVEALESVRIGSESLAETFNRTAQILATFDQATALLGARFGESRTDAIQFGAELAALFGDDAGAVRAAFNRIFEAFYTEAERAEAAAQSAGQEARRLLTDLLAGIDGFDFTDALLTEGGFRDLFESLTSLGTLTAEQTAILLRAGIAVADLADAQDQLNGTTDDSTDAINRRAEALRLEAEAAEFLADIQQQTLDLLAPSYGEYNELSQAIAENMAQARGLANSEQALTAVRRLAQLQTEQFVGRLRASIQSLLDAFLQSPADAFADQVGTVEQAAQQMGGAIAGELDNAANSIRDWLDGELFGSTSNLTPEERLAAAQSQFDQAIATTGFDTGLADQLLDEAASFYGRSSEQFAALRDAVRAQAEGAMGETPSGRGVGAFHQQTAQIAEATRGTLENTASTAQYSFEQVMAANDLIQQVALLSRITGDSPAEIGAEFGIPIDRLIQAVTGELPELTGGALAEHFDALVGSIDDELSVLMDMQAVQDAELAVLQSIDATLREISGNPSSLPTSSFVPSGPSVSPGPDDATLREISGNPSSLPTSSFVPSGPSVSPGPDDALNSINESIQRDSTETRAELRAIREELERIGDQTDAGNADRRRAVQATVAVEQAVTRSAGEISRAVRDARPQRRGVGG